MIQNFKKFCKDNEADIILVIGVILISLISFGGGWLIGTNSNSSSTTANENIKIENISPENLEASVVEETPQNTAEETKTNTETQNSNTNITNTNQSTTTEKQIVASKNGSVYHYIWCPGAKQIKEENKIYFNSKEEAEAAGYRPAKNCPGLEE
jgi:hypothetical protein